jgi:hypothetical protein
MKIALASPPFPKSINDGLYWVEKLVKEAILGQAGSFVFRNRISPGIPVKSWR